MYFSFVRWCDMHDINGKTCFFFAMIACPGISRYGRSMRNWGSTPNWRNHAASSNMSRSLKPAKLHFLKIISIQIDLNALESWGVRPLVTILAAPEVSLCWRYSAPRWCSFPGPKSWSQDVDNYFMLLENFEDDQQARTCAAQFWRYLEILLQMMGRQRYRKSLCLVGQGCCFQLNSVSHFVPDMGRRFFLTRLCSKVLVLCRGEMSRLVHVWRLAI